MISMLGFVVIVVFVVIWMCLRIVGSFVIMVEKFMMVIFFRGKREIRFFFVMVCLLMFLKCRCLVLSCVFRECISLVLSWLFDFLFDMI